MRLATICLVMYWIAIFLATHVPGSTLPAMAGSDKAYHFLAYSGLAFLLCWAMQIRLTRWRQSAFVLAIAMSYACLDELTQALIPGRQCDLWDWTADLVGVLFGIGSYLAAQSLLRGWGSRR